MKIHSKISVIGKVQGVWFRKSTQLEARKLGLTGFVSNEDDGSIS
jgi:acylphosphatase